MEQDNQKLLNISFSSQGQPLNNSFSPVPQAQSVVPVPPVVSTNEQGNNNAILQQEVKADNPPIKPKLSFKKLLKIIFPIAILLLLGVVAFFMVDKFNAPAKIKQKASIAQPIFYDLDAVNKKIAEQLKSEMSSDADSIQREQQKGEGYLETAKKDIEQLTANMDAININEFNSYKDYMKKYLKNSNELATMEEEGMLILGNYQSPIEKMQKVAVDVSGASIYMYSDTKKYISILNKAITDENEIIGELEEMNFPDDWKPQHELLIKTIERQRNYMKSLVEAVEERDSEKIAITTKTYAQEEQDLSKESSRLNDEFNAKVDKLLDKSNSLSEMIKEEYSQLKIKYNF